MPVLSFEAAFKAHTVVFTITTATELTIIFGCWEIGTCENHLVVFSKILAEVKPVEVTEWQATLQFLTRLLGVLRNNILPNTRQSITVMWNARGDGGNDSWETALLSLSFRCVHFETSEAICLAVRYARGKRRRLFSPGETRVGNMQGK